MSLILLRGIENDSEFNVRRNKFDVPRDGVRI